MEVSAARVKLDKALKRLSKSEGRVARRNARAAFLRAQRELRKAVNGEYPTLKKEKKPVTQGPPKSDEQKLRDVARRRRKRMQRLVNEGFACADVNRHKGIELVAWAVDAKVRVVQMKNEKAQLFWIPAWVSQAENLAEVKKAKKNKDHRDYLVAKYYVALAADADTGMYR